jgi:glycosyltransferase involved in cell wall biosynthesis
MVRDYVAARGPLPELSFIIPAYNEERFITEVVRRIHELVRGRHDYEIIVADHGSSDRTVELARAQGAAVFVHTGGTIGRLRNLGATHAAGGVFVFLDADILLTERWIDHLDENLALLRARPRTLTGALCGVPANSSWIERCWFDPAQRNHRVTHIGSAHLITTRAFYEELGGFTESLRTGEDYDLSARALALGGQIVDDPRLHVEHWGYPRSLAEFVRREIWHGQGDFRSVRTAVRSKVALLTVVFLGLHVSALSALLSGRPILSLTLVALVAILCLACSRVKYQGRPWSIIATNSVLYYFYFAGRTMALAGALAGTLRSPTHEQSRTATGRGRDLTPTRSD